jgi:hypothetical protein
MKWLPRYLRELWNWAFSRLGPYQRFSGLITIAAVLVGVGLAWLSTFLGVALLGLLALFFFFVAPACIWHEQDQELLDLKLRLSGQPRPLVIIDSYESTYIEDFETGKPVLVETLCIFNRGKEPAVNIGIPRIQYRNRTANLLSPLPTSLGPDQSIDARILNLEYVLSEINKSTPKVIGSSWSVRIPLTVKYSDLNHTDWTTDHAIVFDIRGIRFDLVHPGEPQEWTDTSDLK